MRTFIALVLATVVSAASAVACLWDTETLLEERSAMPSVLEMIVGKFARHSPAYYEWRIEDRLGKLKQDPENDRWLDDLAVAYEKLDRHDEAIEVAHQQLARNPDRYESLANLGTFLIHSGQFEQGLEYIERAIEVNPDAHFGREKYQAILVKYVMAHSGEGEVELPLGKARLSVDAWKKVDTFDQFAAKELSDGEQTNLTEQQRQSATEGILGMMRFSQHDHPILLEVLGELLEYEEHWRLAYRAYVSAADAAPTKDAKQAYLVFARRAISMQYEEGNYQRPIPVEFVSERFDQEKADADAWFAELVAQEAEWIGAGEDVDARFNETYRDPPVTIEFEEPDPTPRDAYISADASSLTLSIASILACAAAIAGVIVVAARRVFHARRDSSAQATQTH